MPTPYTKPDYSPQLGLAKELRRQRGAALVLWEHNAIPEIAKHLGIEEELE